MKTVATPEIAAQQARRIEAEYPDASCSLDFADAFQLLVATVLSAQTTDVRVNTVTPELFARYPDAAAMAGANVEDVEAIVRPLGFQRRRAAQLVTLGERLVEDFRGRVPGSRQALESLPGVGRKTASVVLGDWFGEAALTVDTHVGRLARRLGWSGSENPRQVERDVEALLPDRDWTFLSHALIEHGRAVCTAKAPDCGHCVVQDICPSAGEF